MTLVTTPVTIQSGGESAEMFRRLFYTLSNGRPGIMLSGDFAVTQNGTPNMSVNVADGRCFVLGTESSVQGLYFCENRNTQNVVVGASHATLGRRDLVVVRIRDATYSGATNSAAIEVIAGTPSGSPVDPAVPANCLVLARVVVAAASSTVTNAFIDDIRTGASGYTSQGGRAAGLGGVIVCTSAFRPTVNLYDGLHAYETDTDKLIVYNGSAWVEANSYAQSDSWSPTIIQSGTATRTLNRGTFARRGRRINGEFHVTITGSGTGANVVTASAPVTAAFGANTMVVGSGYIFDVSAATIYFGPVVMQTTTTFAIMLTTGQAGANGFTAGLASPDQVSMSVSYEAAT